MIGPAMMTVLNSLQFNVIETLLILEGRAATYAPMGDTNTLSICRSRNSAIPARSPIALDDPSR
jgi:hypothetical protein